MKTLFAAALTASVALAGFAAAPASAQDRYGHYQTYDRGDYRGDGYRDRGEYREYRGDYRNGGYDGYRNRHYRGAQRCGSGTTGTIVGGVIGALLGGEVGRGSGYYNKRSGTGTIVGAGVGALVGREIDRGGCNNNRRHYR